VLFKLGLIVVATLTLASAAHAATFTAVPPLYSQSGGPFTIAFRTQGAQESLGVSYKLSTEATWHRCLSGPQSVTLGPLPDGQYAVQIADDISLNYWASIGQLYSGHTAPCSATPPPENLLYAPTTYTFVVDGVAPQVSDVSAQTAGKTTRLTAQAADPLSGIDRVDWTLGDGSSRITTTPQLDYAYLAVGTYTGSMRVVDRAGNVAARSFSVTVADAVAAAPPSIAPAAIQGPASPSAACIARRKQLSTARKHEISARATYRKRHTAATRKRWTKARTLRIKRQRSVAAQCP
jgi:hypothetical protein